MYGSVRTKVHTHVVVINSHVGKYMMILLMIEIQVLRGHVADTMLVHCPCLYLFLVLHHDIYCL